MLQVPPINCASAACDLNQPKSLYMNRLGPNYKVLAIVELNTEQVQLVASTQACTRCLLG